MTDLTESSNTTADESHNADDRWTATHKRTPYENVRALLRQLGPTTPTTTVLRIAYRRLPVRCPEDDAIVESVREELAREQAIARAKRWYCTCTDPPTITISAEQTTARDTRTTVTPEDIITAAEHYLGKHERGCENPGGVIDCTGPTRAGYRCPDCYQQGQRETAILDALLDAMTADSARESRSPAVADGGER